MDFDLEAHWRHLPVTPGWPTAQCIAYYSRVNKIPVPVALAVMKTEGGKPGSYIKNTNGSYDMGVMQINTVWVEHYSKMFGVSPSYFMRRTVFDGCFSVMVGLDILGTHVAREKSLAKGVAAYHSRTPSVGSKYLGRVTERLKEVLSGKLPRISGIN